MSQVRVVEEGQEVTLISTNGIVLRTTVDEISIRAAPPRARVIDEGDKLYKTVIPVEEVAAGTRLPEHRRRGSSFAAQSASKLKTLKDSMEAPDSEYSVGRVGRTLQ